MTSWLDTKKYVASLAKNAIAEAQKTLDKALDIDENGEQETEQSENKEISTSNSSSVIQSNVNLGLDQWGSFSGSFFSIPPDRKASAKSNSRDELSILPHSQSDPVSLQPTKASDLLLQTVIPEVDDDEPVKPPSSEPIVIEANGPALMQESDECPILEETTSDMTCPVIQDESKLETSMSSSRTTLVSAIDPSSSPPSTGIKLDSTLTEEDQETMIEDAMKVERSEASSSSKSYEMLKVESYPTSGHTSGDDVEVITNNSSDIEVISSPVLSEKSFQAANNQRLIQTKVMNYSPSKDSFRRKAKGHLRTGSEISSCTSAEDTEVDRLLKKMSEMTEILDARESKLVELSKSNLELQETNMDLSSQVKEAMKINAKLSEANVSSEEFTERLATMEKKLQQTIVERDKYQSELKTLKKEAANRLSDAEIAEKDEIITDLRAEGESLSKQVGKHSEIIKKLRSKEKSNEKEIKNLKDKVEDKTKECERLNKSLEAKNEVESKQIEAIQNLTKANTQWEDTNKTMSSDLEDANEKVNGLRLSLEGAYKEMAEMRRGLSEKEDQAQEMALAKETEARQLLQEQLREQQEQNRQESDKFLRQIDELRETLAANERTSARMEERMQREREDLMAKLQESEARHEALTGNISASTRPLIRQLESVQAALSEARSNSDRAERSLTERLQQSTVQLASAQERERNAAEQYRQLSSKTASLESKLTSLSRTKNDLEQNLNEVQIQVKLLEENKLKEKSVSQTMKQSLGTEISELKDKLKVFEFDNEKSKEMIENEKAKNVSLLEQLKDRDRRLKELSTELESAKSYRAKSSSPAFSIASMNSEQTWPDEVFESRGIGSGYEGIRMLTGTSGSSSALLESLQSQLKQREGENVQMQMELVRMEKVKSNLTSELARLSHEAEKLEIITSELDELKISYQETEAKYQTMLTMYGEKVEETEELRLDLQDVKDMYKMQIEDLLRKQTSNSKC